MGRAMLIICAGVLVSLGIIGISTADRGKMLTEESAKYANKMTTRNAAHTAIQIAMQKISDDTTWAATHNSSNKWTTTINNVQDTLYVEYLNSDWKTNPYWESDSIRIVSKAAIKTNRGIHKSTVTSVYLMAKFSNLVPNPPAAVSIPTNQFTPNFGGSASISGNEASGTCPNKPALAVRDDISSTKKTEIENEMANLKEVEGGLTEGNLSYEPTDELIARLKATDAAKTIAPEGTSTNYKGSLGTKDNPGAFFVEGNVKLTGGISEGYGILVIRSYGGMTYQDSTGATVDIAGNFKFNGLVVFENAFNFNGKGTPTINGSVLIGHTQEFLDNNPTEVMNIDLSGNLHLQYDCKAQDYAKMAAANSVKQNKYTRVVTYE